MVRAFDTRPAVKEKVQPIGAEFLKVNFKVKMILFFLMNTMNILIQIHMDVKVVKEQTFMLK